MVLASALIAMEPNNAVNVMVKALYIRQDVLGSISHALHVVEQEPVRNVISRLENIPVEEDRQELVMDLSKVV